MRGAQAQPQGERPTGLLFARQGRGPLLQRDYWAVIDQSRLSPAQLVDVLALHFERFAPEELVVFRRHRDAPLELRDELTVRIKGAGSFAVRVLHRDAQSLTLGTLEGHPEAGRITFGAYRNRRGEVIFHIRSRARASSRLRYLGFVGAGEPMQTNTWTAFVNRVAVYAGAGVRGWIHSVTGRCADEAEDAARGSPTFAARGG